MIHLAVKDEFALMKWSDKLKILEKQFVEFHEPDLGNGLTAIACIDEGEVFKKLQLA